MKTITYIPQNENNNNLLATVTETNHATFSVSKDGVFNVVDNNQLNVGKGSTMKVTIPKDELINIIVKCSVIKHKNVKIERPSIYVTKGNSTTKTSIKCTESETKSLGIFNIKDYTLTFPMKSPKETTAVIHFGNEINIIKQISVATS